MCARWFFLFTTSWWWCVACRIHALWNVSDSVCFCYRGFVLYYEIHGITFGRYGSFSSPVFFSFFSSSSPFRWRLLLSYVFPVTKAVYVLCWTEKYWCFRMVRHQFHHLISNEKRDVGLTERERESALSSLNKNQPFIGVCAVEHNMRVLIWSFCFSINSHASSYYIICILLLSCRPTSAYHWTISFVLTLLHEISSASCLHSPMFSLYLSRFFVVCWMKPTIFGWRINRNQFKMCI